LSTDPIRITLTLSGLPPSSGYNRWDGRRKSVADFAAVFDFDDQNDELAVIDLAENPEVADPISPKLPEVPSKRFPKLARVLASLDSFVEKSDHALAGLRAEFAQLFGRPVWRSYSPSSRLASSLVNTRPGFLAVSAAR